MLLDTEQTSNDEINQREFRPTMPYDSYDPCAFSVTCPGEAKRQSSHDQMLVSL